jgi:hypothetical protein
MNKYGMFLMPWFVIKTTDLTCTTKDTKPVVTNPIAPMIMHIYSKIVCQTGNTLCNEYWIVKNRYDSFMFKAKTR